jgi:hypothetical protein
VLVVFEQVKDKLFILHKLHVVGVDQIGKTLDGEGFIEEELEEDDEVGILVGQCCEGRHATQVRSVLGVCLMHTIIQSTHTICEKDMLSFT